MKDIIDNVIVQQFCKEFIKFIFKKLEENKRKSKEKKLK